jgi:CheY-like chemotaxis protein
MTSEPMYQKNSSSPPSALDGSKLILSVDDELGVLYTRYKLLATHGYAVLSATDGVQALQIFGHSPVDLVLLDFALPGMDGGVIAEAMKEYKPDVLIIILSGVEVPPKCLATANGYVRKGEGPEPLLHSIRRLLATTSKPQIVPQQVTP